MEFNILTGAAERESFLLELFCARFCESLSCLALKTLNTPLSPSLASVWLEYTMATPSHTLVSGHSQAYKWMRAGGLSGLQDYRLYCDNILYVVLLFAQFSKFMLILFLVKLNQQHK